MSATELDLGPFARDIGPVDAGPVTCVGLGTRGDVGGPVDPSAKVVCAPMGIVAFQPEEMTVRCGAGTAVEELQAALAERGQFVALPPGGTVGGALAVGHSSRLRLGHGHVRDALLQARFVGADGAIVRAGGPTVKNVSGYDLCRLLVGSLGTLGLLGEVILRTRPLPAVRCWFAGSGDSQASPFTLVRALHRPAAVLWDGTTTWLCLEGHPDDVAAQRAVAGPSFVAVDGPPAAPGPHRWSLPPSALRALRPDADGPFLAEVGVGLVHRTVAAPLVPPSAAVAEISRRLRIQFDPTGRLNPGRVVVPPPAAADGRPPISAPPAA